VKLTINDESAITAAGVLPLTNLKTLVVRQSVNAFFQCDRAKYYEFTHLTHLFIDDASVVR
jgi:hypothetical protein